MRMDRTTYIVISAQMAFKLASSKAGLQEIISYRQLFHTGTLKTQLLCNEKPGTGNSKRKHIQ